MGQYYRIVNIDKKEFIHPHKFGDGLKLMEFGLSGMGTMAGLAILLADGNGRGGGDINEDPISKIIGRWAGNRIVIAGDYADEGRFVTSKDVGNILVDSETPGCKTNLRPSKINLNSLTDLEGSPYKDISHDVIFALMADSYVRETYVKAAVKGQNVLMKEDVVKDFNLIHGHLAENKDMALLVGRLKSDEGKIMLEKFLKREAKEKRAIKKAGGK